MIDHGSHAPNLSSCEIKAWKNEGDSNPWPLQYWCSALLTELSSQLEAGHFASSQMNTCIPIKSEKYKWINVAFIYIFMH